MPNQNNSNNNSHQILPPKTQKYSFINDYAEGAHPDILALMSATNFEQHTGYGFDVYSDAVRQMIEQAVGKSLCHFCIAGTQTNLVCLSALLRPIEAVICANTGHIAVNEAGAIEATGHKVITADSTDGKLTVFAIDQVLKRFPNSPHVVQPKVVYISNSTELGTVYTRQELAELYQFCQNKGLYLFMDGARLGAALASPHQDMTLADIANHTDMFWLGGTKMGALFGEAIIIPNHQLAKNFPSYQKQHGALLAKSRILAQQFMVLLKNDLYLDLCRHANQMALQIGDAFIAQGFRLQVPVQSNQVFVILNDAMLKKLQEHFEFYVWDELGNGQSVARFVTSWATQADKVAKLVELINKSSQHLS